MKNLTDDKVHVSTPHTVDIKTCRLQFKAQDIGYAGSLYCTKKSACVHFNAQFKYKTEKQKIAQRQSSL